MFDHTRYVEFHGVGASVRCDGKPVGLLSDIAPNLRWFEVGAGAKLLAIGLDNLQPTVQPLDRRLNMLAAKAQPGELCPVPRWRQVEVFSSSPVHGAREIEPGKWLIAKRRLAPQKQDTVTIPADGVGQITLAISSLRPGGGNTLLMGEIRFNVARGKGLTPLPDNQELLLCNPNWADSLPADAGVFFAGVLKR
ncbi:MAG: hypothetical protein WCT32_00830 [Patescibacteria group bacterium]|jgi:hypothetical protein